MKSVEDVPDFVKSRLGWTKATMMEEAMIFFIFNNSCQNHNGAEICDNFSEKKCSKCKMDSFCSTECFDQEWNHGHHGHCCENTVRMKVYEMTRSVPKFLHTTLSVADKEIVTLETFCRELLRRIVLMFMELLANTPLMRFALERRGSTPFRIFYLFFQTCSKSCKKLREIYF